MTEPIYVRVNKLMDKYESGESMSNSEVTELFSYHIRTDLAWELQGSYGRAANAMINNGFISKDGEILWDGGDDNG